MTEPNQARGYWELIPCGPNRFRVLLASLFGNPVEEHHTTFNAVVVPARHEFHYRKICPASENSSGHFGYSVDGDKVHQHFGEVEMIEMRMP